MNRQIIAKYLSLFLMGTLLWSSHVMAHPHVWADIETTLVFNEQGFITGIDEQWSFDETYAQEALDGLDSDGDGFYSPQELEPLTKQNMEALRDYNYFTFAKANDEKIALGEPVNYGQIYSNNKLTLHFHMPLKTPLNPRDSKFSLNIYDPDFYIEFAHSQGKESLDTEGNMPATCQLHLKPVPTTDELNQTRSLLSSKDKDWKPDNKADFGAMFSETVLVECGV